MVLTRCERNHHHSLSLAGASEVDSRPVQMDSNPVTGPVTGVISGSDTPAVVVVATSAWDRPGSAWDRSRSAVGPIEAGLLASALGELGAASNVADVNADGKSIRAEKI